MYENKPIVSTQSISGFSFLLFMNQNLWILKTKKLQFIDTETKFDDVKIPNSSVQFG